MNKAHSPCIPIPDKCPHFTINANGEKPVDQHWEFNTIEGFLKIKKTHVLSGALTNVPSNEFLGCKDCISAASELADWLRCGKLASVRVGSSLDRIRISKILDKMEFRVIPR